jgi:FkbM family methyltransferase
MLKAWYKAWPGSWYDSWRTIRGVVRSLRLYYGDRERRAAMDRLYSRFVNPGDLVFDIGAHVGDRVAVFRRIGARVVAVEPQPALIRTLKLLYGRDRALAIEPVAVGRRAGMLELKLNVDNPTVSTASEAFRKAAHGASGWEGQAWTRTIRVPVTTLDALFTRHGTPAFIKIDVEGSEADALAGLTRPSAALSFEFTTILRGEAARPMPWSIRTGWEPTRSRPGFTPCRTAPIRAISTRCCRKAMGGTGAMIALYPVGVPPRPAPVRVSRRDE